MTPVFTSKLDTIFASVELALDASADELAARLAQGKGRLAVAVGSGGSAVTAAYFALCRETLFGDSTMRQTPLEFVLSGVDFSAVDVWLMSANGSNPDVLASFDAALARRARINVMTSKADGELARRARAAGAGVFLTPVAEPKDGFLATHSLVSAVMMLLKASDALLPEVDEGRPHNVAAAMAERFSKVNRRLYRDALGSISPEGLLLVLSDPRLVPAAVLIETSVWETALCAVQLTDFRNFAHGRHVWLAKRPEKTFVLSMTGIETREAWSTIADLVPDGITRFTRNYGLCGRLDGALALADGLCTVEAIGMAVGIDPGKPGHGQFAPSIFDAGSLPALAARLTQPVRAKRSEMLKHDRSIGLERCVSDSHADMVRRFAEACFGGLVLDYDGTVVPTEDREAPPSAEILSELERLLDAEVLVAFATGRGGSAGKVLREAIAPKHHPSILIGYYNGAYLRTLDVDIDVHKAPRNSLIERVDHWLAGVRETLGIQNYRNSGPQITIDLAGVTSAEDFRRALESTDEGSSGQLRLVRTGHSLDICPIETSKTSVVEEVRGRLVDRSTAVLCIGDSGARASNDHALLATNFGVSVREVSDSADSCCSLFGDALTGPAALLTILRALEITGRGQARLRVDWLSAGSFPQNVAQKANSRMSQ